MKKSKLFVFGLILPAIFSLTGCIFDPFPSEEIVIEPPKIELVSSMKINLRKRTQKKLNPVLSNTEIKNPVFLYGSSNSEVATVAGDGTITAIAPGTCRIQVVLQSNTDVKTSVDLTVTNDETSEYDYTLMFYMCGSDLEYSDEAKRPDQHGFFSRDIQEMLSVKNIPDSVKIIIETGGSKQWQMPSNFLENTDGGYLSKISSTNLQRWEINNATNKLRLIETLPGNYMAKESSFEEFLNWGLDDYEADQMGVILSGHGGGIGGCAYDDNYTYIYGDGDEFPNTLNTQEVATAAKAALSNSSKDKFTWIGYDCCVMQCADIASINADYFDYMVASQDLENATGWNHDGYLPYLKDNTKIAPTDFLPKICDTFVAENHSVETVDDPCYQTLSVLDLAKMDDFTSAFNILSNSIGSFRISYEKVKVAFKASYNLFGDSIYGLCDFSSLLSNLKLLSYNVSAVETALDNLVLYKKYCSKYSITPCGVNAFFPESLDEKYILQVGKEDYSSVLSTRFTTWQKMCLLHGDFGW